MIIMANLPPPNDDPNIPEDEPVNLEPALVVPNPAPMQPKIVLNDVDEENMEEDLQENLEEEEELEDDDDDMNDVEVINPFEEANLLNQPPPDFEAEWRHVPTGCFTTQLLPTIRRYSSDVYFGESSSSAAMRDVEHYHIGMEYYRDMAQYFCNDLARFTWHHHHLRQWSLEMRMHLLQHFHYQERPYEPTYAPASAAPADPNDLYVAARV
ncbi:hypothetical protein Tco_0421886, partial [Tanacetum coccineum]